MFVWPRVAVAACLILVATGTEAISVEPANNLGVQSGTQQTLPGGRAFEAKNIKLTDAGQSEATSGIIALYPRAVDTQTLAIPCGEPREDLHVTLVYVGDASGPGGRELERVLDDFTATHFYPITAQVFGRAVLNPNPTDEKLHSAVVYLVGDSTDLAPLRHR